MTRAALPFVLVLAWAAAASAQAVLSLDDAVAMAFEHNRGLQNASLAEERAAHDVAIARTRRLPVFGVETQVSRLLKPVNITFPEGAFGSFPSTGPVPATDTTVTTPARATIVFDASVSQPLTQLIQASLNVRLGEGALELERERTRAARLSLINSVKRSYYAILQTNSAIAAAETNVRLLEELNRVVGSRVAQQVALKAEGLDVQARVAQVELSLLTLRHSVTSSKEHLNLLLGRDVRTEFDVAAPLAPTRAELDLDIARSRAIASRPDVRQARVTVRQAELSRGVARAEYLPEISVALQSISPVNIDGAPRNISSVGVQLKWEPFDWGRRRQTVASRSLEVLQARNALSDTEGRAVIEINSEFRKFEEARGRLRVAGLSQRTAEEQARVRVEQYRVKAALFSDVLQSQATYAETNNQYQQALLSLMTASADFEQALGEDVTR